MLDDLVLDLLRIGNSPMGIQWESNGNPMGTQWESNGNPMGIQWESNGNPRDKESTCIKILCKDTVVQILSQCLTCCQPLGFAWILVRSRTKSVMNCLPMHTSSRAARSYLHIYIYVIYIYYRYILYNLYIGNLCKPSTHMQKDCCGLVAHVELP